MEGRYQMAEQQKDFTDSERFEFLTYQHNRLDSFRVSLANRAGLIITAATLVLAGTTYLLDKTQIIKGFNVSKGVLYGGAVVTFLFVLISIVLAMNVIVTLKKSSLKLADPVNQPEPLYFHPKKTIRYFKGSYKNYSDAFYNLSQKELVEYALSANWYALNLFERRYKYLTWAMRFLFAGILTFFVSVLIYLISVLN
jgi:hypothetical protein